MSQASSERDAPKPASIWNVPYARNPHFTGRAQSLAEIKQRFSGKSPAERVQVILGSGGIGKTQLAVEYAYKHRWDYEIVWWLNADDAALLTIGYARVGQRLGLTFSEETSGDDIRHVVRSVLNERGNWLLIFDGAITAPQVLDFLPPKPIAGNVIVTSRNPHWSDAGGIIQLSELKRGESIALLRKRTGRNDSNESASKLAQALGDLPIALNQAAAVIDRTQASFSDYLVRFESLWAELLQRGIKLGEHPDAIAMAWELCIREVESVAPAHADLLNLCAFVAPAPISRATLADWGKRAPPQLQETLHNPLYISSAIDMLRAFSMLEADERTITVHPMVAAAARHRLDRDALRRWIDAAVRCVGESFQFQSDDLTTWTACGEILPHALAAAEFGESEDVALLEVAELLDNAGRYLHRTGQMVQARDLLSRALRIHEHLSGFSHPKVAAVANDLGRVLTRLGEHREAEQCFRRALEIDQTTYGLDDPHTATVMNNYGMTLHACGDRIGAREQFEVALNVYERHYGEDHPKTASVLNNLGYVMQELGEPQEAKACFERALSITQVSHGPEHPKVASILGNLGNVRRVLSEFLQARQDLERALRIDEAAYGPAHPDVARDWAWLGMLYQSTDQPDEARKCFERACAIDEAVYGRDHPLLVSRLKALGKLLKHAGDVDGSQQYFERAATILAESRRRVAS